jgi:hypothetical protein
VDVSDIRERGLQVDQRIPVTEIAGGRVEIRWGRGRVELGRARGSQLRVRISGAETRRPFRRGPEVTRSASGLEISARQGRLQVDLPDGLTVQVTLDRGEITSWGAGGVLSLVSAAGSVTCRELTAPEVRASASRVSLHFAQPPKGVEVDAEQATVSVPGGEYAVTAPPGAEVTLSPSPDAPAKITVRAADARILASQAPLKLTDEAASGS